jgi:hypothetical protein
LRNEAAKWSCVVSDLKETSIRNISKTMSFRATASEKRLRKMETNKPDSGNIVEISSDDENSIKEGS